MYLIGMRRLTERYKTWLIFRQEYEEKRRLATENLKKIQNKKIKFRNVTINPPPVLSFTKNPSATGAFFEEVRSQINKVIVYPGRLVIDLSTLNELSPAAALCLLAELDRWQILRNITLRPITIGTWAPHIVRDLADMGFFEVLDTPIHPSIKDGGPGARRFIRFVAGARADTEKQARFQRAIGSSLESNVELSLGLYRSLIEAIGNSVEHAYPERGSVSENMRRSERWWLTGVVDETAGRLKVVTLDHGISIPGSLPASRQREGIMATLDDLRKKLSMQSHDGLLLQAAMEYGRTRLQSPGRGKGLGDVLALADLDPENRLRIISRRGTFMSDTHGTRADRNAFSLNGTLIEWDLSLTAPMSGAVENPSL